MSASKSFRSFSMPLGMVVGALFCRQIVWVDAALQGMLTPMFIFTENGVCSLISNCTLFKTKEYAFAQTSGLGISH